MRPSRIEPGPGQESVWDYPRPPRGEPVPERIVIELGGRRIVDPSKAFRVLETAGPPVYYMPPGDIAPGAVVRSQENGSWCEWKGSATYWTVRAGDREETDAAWSYEDPAAGFEAIAGHLGFYCGRMDRCMVGDEVATPQPGRFYGGWVTPRIVGPFKGEPGTSGW